MSHEKPTANTMQIGGDHYKAEYQHWDFVERNGLGYLEGCATKYVSRWRKKNGRQDLEKARHYVIKLKELFVEGVRKPKTSVHHDEVNSFCESNRLSVTEKKIIFLLSKWSTVEDLVRAIWGIDELIFLATEVEKACAPNEEN